LWHVTVDWDAAVQPVISVVKQTSRAPDPQYGTHSLAECCEPDVQGTPPSTKKDES